MNILCIKQTSLGDVLHASGHLRALKEHFRGSHLTVLTAQSSAEILQRNPHIDELILHRRGGMREFCKTLRRVRARRYDIALDLQGLARTAVFLYAARARKKFIKGNFPGVHGFRNKNLHAIAEMDGVLRAAGIEPGDTAMQWFADDAARARVEKLLARINPHNFPLIVCSPFSRWPSKDWPLQNYATLAEKIPHAQFAFCGAQHSRARIAAALAHSAARVHNFAGELTLAEFAELIARARLAVSGDSFPMHLAAARGVPLLALYAPTLETRTAPRAKSAAIIVRAPGCARCDRRNCARNCLAKVPVDAVLHAVRAHLPRAGGK